MEAGGVQQQSVRRISGQVIVGALMLVIGVLFLLRNLGVPVPRFGNLWPLVLVAVGVAKGMQVGFRRSFWGNVLIAVGFLYLLQNFHLLPVRVFSLWPILLIAIGIRVLGQGALGFAPAAPLAGAGSSESVLNETAAFGGGERKVATQDFRGGEVTVAFGGFDIDLRESAIASGQAVIHVLTAFGGADLKVPPTWSVTLNVVSIFGGCDDRTVHPTDPNAPRLLITGTTVFGGIEVAN